MNKELLIRRESSLSNLSNAKSKYCSAHGHRLEFYCFEENDTVCKECIKTEHKTHKFNFLNICATINQEELEDLLATAQGFHVNIKGMRGKLAKVRSQIRSEVISLQTRAHEAIELICAEFLANTKMSDFVEIELRLKNFQKELCTRINAVTDQLQLNLREVRAAIEDERYMEVIQERDRIERLKQETADILSEMNSKLFEAEEVCNVNAAQPDLKDVKQLIQRGESIKMKGSLFDRENRIVVFLPNTKSLAIHDMRFLTRRNVTVEAMEHPFGNFSCILQSRTNGKIYICGGKQRKKLFELDEVAHSLVEKEEMRFGRSNHAFTEVRGSLVVVGGWDGEKAMTQVEGYSLNAQEWRQLPRLSEPRHSLSCTVINDNVIYAIGGSSAINYGSSSATIERLDLTNPNFADVCYWELIYLFGEFCDSKRSQLGSVPLDPG